MNNSDLVYLMILLCIATLTITIISVGYIYEERITNLEYEISFMKLDLSCERTPLENIYTNYLTDGRLIDGINNWYLKECLN